MKKKSWPKILGIMAAVVIFLSPFLFYKNTYRLSPATAHLPQAVLPYSEISLPDYSGEKLVYEVSLGMVSLGRAVFTGLPATSLAGRPVNQATFETKVARFYDLERIFSDPATSLPVRIERFVTTWPSAENIVEEYDQKAFTVTITKKKGSRQSKLVIKKENVINNAVILPFFIRSTARLDIGFEFVARLPTRQYTIRLVSKEEVEVPAGKFVACKFESIPRSIEVWISDDQERIPVKIKGSGGPGYIMTLREYHRSLK